MLVIGDVDRNNRPHFRAAVTFQWRDAKFLFERFGERGPQLFRSHHQIANGPQLLARAFAQVAQAERGRGKKQRGMMRAGQFANCFGIRWIGMKYGFEALQQWEPERVGVAERVEERQHAEHAIGMIDGKNLRCCIHVREQVPMRKHHAFGCAGAAAGEDHRGQIVRLRRACQRASGQQSRGGHRQGFGHGGERPEQVFQINGAGQFGKLGLFKECSRGQNG